MKKLCLPLILTGIIIIVNSSISSAQYKLLMTETQLEAGDTVRLFVAEHSGVIQWEKSTDMIQWTDIPGETTDSLVYIIDTSLYLRGRINEGTCLPVYTDTFHIEVFICGITAVTDYDGNIYNTVQIGAQCWMKENLKTIHYSDGSEITDGTSVGDIWNDYNTKYWFVYNDDIINKVIYGLLYTWASVVNGTVGSSTNPSGIQGICPAFWHVPSDEEWKQLEMFLGMTQVQADSIGLRGSIEGGMMKESGTVHWNSPNTGASNESGFTARPGGYREPHGTFIGINNYGMWWTSTEYSTTSGWYRRLYYNNSKVYRDKVFEKPTGNSVRCVKD